MASGKQAGWDEELAWVTGRTIHLDFSFVNYLVRSWYTVQLRFYIQWQSDERRGWSENDLPFNYLPPF